MSKKETKSFANIKKTWFENYTFKKKKESGGEFILQLPQWPTNWHVGSSRVVENLKKKKLLE